MTNLKRCPFCGGEAKVAHDVTIVYTWSYISCTKCKARTTYFLMSTEYSSDQRAIEAWNRRVEDETD